MVVNMVCHTDTSNARLSRQFTTLFRRRDLWTVFDRRAHKPQPTRTELELGRSLNGKNYQTIFPYAVISGSTLDA